MPIMPNIPRQPEAREVDRIEALATLNDPARADDFLERCIPGSEWTVQIRTAVVSATLIARNPLGSFDERICTCLSLWLLRTVPVEPGLRFQIVDQNDEALSLTAVVRPWTG
ncbi:MAG: hypothetical protein NVSMB9_15850 [Isosphaeraceae bacterium]